MLVRSPQCTLHLLAPLHPIKAVLGLGQEILPERESINISVFLRAYGYLGALRVAKVAKQAF
jgi:hypothetical protein